MNTLVCVMLSPLLAMKSEPNNGVGDKNDGEDGVGDEITTVKTVLLTKTAVKSVLLTKMILCTIPTVDYWIKTGICR